MRYAILGLFILVGFSLSSATGQQPYRFEGESDLPLVIVDTAGKTIPNDPKIDGRMSIIDHGDGKTNSLMDEPTLVTPIRIEVRGSSSQMFDKKSYGFETVNESGKDENVSLLDLPSESDWVLYGPYNDKSLMRNFLAYDLSNKIGQYAPRTRFVEMFLRDSAAPLDEQYVGVYLLMESIKRGEDRVDVPPLRKKKQELSGGYILKFDRVDGPESYFTSELGTVLGHVSPRGDRIDDDERAWVRQDISRIERVLAGNDFMDPDHGYSQHIDADSFIDYFLLQELFKNVDAYHLSTFLHKADDGKLHMGPLWDLDLTSGNASYGGVWHTEGWMLFPNETRFAGGRPFWWDRLFEDPRFRARLLERWRELRRGEISASAIGATIDEAAQRLDAAQRRNFERWPIMGNYVWPNPRPYSKSYEEEVSRLKQWFANRIEWMDANLERLAEAGPQARIALQ